MDKRRTCPECNAFFSGRSDKRFCTDQCRALYNNKFRSQTERLIANVNKVLRKNYRILRSINPFGMSVIQKEVLTATGFNFNYFTSVYTTKDGNQYLFCYDIGILPLEDHKVRIVEYQSYMKK